MRNETPGSVLACMAAALIGVPAATAGVNPPGTAITYQGELLQAGEPVTGNCDFLVTLYDGDCDNGGQPVGPPFLAIGAPIVDGLFTIQLDFGQNLFNGMDRWLAIEVSCPAGEPFVALSPCQKITPAPLALALPGLFTQQNDFSPNLIGGYDGNTVGKAIGATIGGGGALNLTHHVSGFYGTIGGGVNNTAATEATVGGGDGNSASNTWATVGGGVNNSASGQNATIAGGRANSAGDLGSTIGGGDNNSASNNWATVGGGNSNTAIGHTSTVGGGQFNGAAGQHATVGGGNSNSASGFGSTVGGGAFSGKSAGAGGGNNSASGTNSTVAGGEHNGAGGDWSAVGGGYSNSADGNYSTVGGGDDSSAGGDFATVGGGVSNFASGGRATVGGGVTNSASGGRATVGGGEGNTAGGSHATVGGGFGNLSGGDNSAVGGGSSNDALGAAATVPGGVSNTAAGSASFAAGNNANAFHDGSFVWSDLTGNVFSSGQANEFNVQASGGTRIFSNASRSTGVTLAPGGVSWNAVSDRNVKDNFERVDPREVLERLVAIPIETWTVKGQTTGLRHMGPMAQDFHAAYGLGVDDKHIATVDADGVALAATQGLYGLVQEKEAQIVELRARLSALETLVAQLASQQDGGTK